MLEFHFLRPAWFLFLLPLLCWRFSGWKQSQGSWASFCDPILLKQSLSQGVSKKGPAYFAWSLFFMTLALVGPTWKYQMVSSYQSKGVRVAVLDLSAGMLARDVSPSRLQRAQFLLHDLFQKSQEGMWSLIVYSGEPFVVSPLTLDAKTIDTWVDPLRPELLPVEGHRLDIALEEAARMVRGQEAHSAKIVVMTGDPPSAEACAVATTLAQAGLQLSIVPFQADSADLSAFADFAKAGNGLLLPLDAHRIEAWVAGSASARTIQQVPTKVRIWEDEGRWFLFPAGLCLLATFRRQYWESRLK